MTLESNQKKKEKEKPILIQLDLENFDYVLVKGGPDIPFRIRRYNANDEPNGWCIMYPLIQNGNNGEERWKRIKEFLIERGNVDVSEFSPYMQHRYQEFTKEEQHLIDLITVHTKREYSNRKTYRYALSDKAKLQVVLREDGKVKYIMERGVKNV